MKAMVLALGLVAVLAAVIGLSLAAPGGAQAQAAPGNVRAVDGSVTSEVVVGWNAVADASFYRVGWVLMSDIPAVQADGRNWLDAFDFKDVENRGQTTQTLRGLLPGVQYAFIVGSVSRRFGVASGWSEWTYLTTAGAESCPTDNDGLPQAPPGTTTPTPTAQPWAATPTPVPTATPAATPTSTPAATPTPVPTQAGAASGDYDADDDGLIEITTLAQLDAIRHDLDGDGVSTHADYAAAFPDALTGMGCREGCSGYELAADLDFAPNGNSLFDAGDPYWNDGAGWLPIGASETQFQYDYNTTFNGNDHTIANIYISRPDASHVGFFRVIGENGYISNLGLTALNVTGSDRVGGLAGDNDGIIVNSYTTGRVNGGGRVGGLAGYNSSVILNSYSSVPASVRGTGDYVGGLVGYSVGGIYGSYATGNIAGESDYVGGLVGYSADTGNIVSSYATGSITGGSDRVGGLVGYSAGGITASYATGNVAGVSRYVGGLVGVNHNGAITASYATGSVTGGDYSVGGLVGYSDGTVTDSYATGGVIGERGRVGGLVGSNGGTITASYATGSVRPTDSHSVGGLVGEGSASTVTVSYWDTQTTGQSNSVGGTGKATVVLQKPTSSTGIYASWNAEWWDFGTSRQYPALKYQGMDVAAQRQ